jgi:hypothetical protein
MFEIMSDLFQCICTLPLLNSHTHIYISHLINDMKLESSQFIYYPKRAELLFA